MIYPQTLPLWAVFLLALGCFQAVSIAVNFAVWLSRRTPGAP